MKRKGFISNCAIGCTALIGSNICPWGKFKGPPIRNSKDQLLILFKANNLGVPLLVIGCYNNNEINSLIGASNIHLRLCHAILDANYPIKIRCSGIKKNKSSNLEVKNSFWEFSPNSALKFIEQPYSSELNFKILSVYFKSGTFHLFKDFSFKISKEENTFHGKLEKNNDFDKLLPFSNENRIFERILQLNEYSYAKGIRISIDTKSGNIISQHRI